MWYTLNMFKGHKHTEESKEKNRLAHLGKPMHPKTLAALRKANLGGNKTSFKKGMKPWNKGLRLARLQNENNYAWKGENVSYAGLHKWVERNLGKANKCTHCWVLNAKKYEWANVSKEYKRDLTDWISLCVSCHSKFDNKAIPVLQRNLNGDLIKRWESMIDAQRHGGFDVAHIGKVCKGYPRYKTHKGFKWEYAK